MKISYTGTTMSKTDFVEAYKHRMAGWALFGITSECKDGLMTRATRLMELPETAVALLGELYEAAQPEKLPEGVNAIVERFMASYEALTPGEGKEAVDLLRKRLRNESETKVAAA